MEFVCSKAFVGLFTMHGQYMDSCNCMAFRYLVDACRMRSERDHIKDN